VVYTVGMTISVWLKQAAGKLETVGIGSARLDALVLLEDITGVGRARLLAEPATEIEPEKLAKLEKLLKRRVRHEPLAYIRGKTEFYGREFVLTPAVLQPRPESEAMIDLLKALVRDWPSGLNSRQKLKIADIGTGSGAIGITALLELPNITVELLDIDAEVLKIAKTNVDKFTLSIKIIRSDLLNNAGRDYDVLLCNLPYVPGDYQINTAAMHEPKIAIFGGPDGLDLYRKLFSQAAKHPKQPLYILTEALPPQHPALEKIAARSGYKLCQNNDFVQLFKCIQNRS
jgi:release factor glutamine methyltransferase